MDHGTLVLHNVGQQSALLVLNSVSNGYNFEMIGSGQQRLLTGCGYSSAAVCVRAMLSLKDQAHHASSFVKCTSPGERFYFVVKDKRGALLAASELFASAAERDQALRQVQRELWLSELVEE